MNGSLTFNSSKNDTVFYCPEQHSNKYVKGVKAAAYIVLIVLSLFGNTVVIRIVYRNPRMRNITNYHIVNMAFADVLTTVFNLLPTVYWVISGLDVWAAGGLAGEVLCKLLNFVQTATISASIFTLCAIATDRFAAIFAPLKRFTTFHVAKIIIVVSWISSIIISAPLLYVLTSVGDKGRATCVENWRPLFNKVTAPRNYTVALFVLLYAFPLITIAFLYLAIMFKLWTRQTPGQELSSNQEKKEKMNRKVLKMLVTVVIVFALSWFPLYVRMFLIFAQSDRYVCGLPYDMDFVCLFLGHANSAINPYIYVIFNENYRKGFRTILHWRNG